MELYLGQNSTERGTSPEREMVNATAWTLESLLNEHHPGGRFSFTPGSNVGKIVVDESLSRYGRFSIHKSFTSCSPALVS